MYFFVVLFLFLLDLRNRPVDIPLKFNALDTAYKTDRTSLAGEYELVQGVPRYLKGIELVLRKVHLRSKHIIIQNSVCSTVN